MKRIQLNIIQYFIILLFSINSTAQSYTIKHLGGEDGLSNDYIVDMEQDGKGFLWIATESGLSRLDGHTFTTYQKSTSNIISDELNTLLYDTEKNQLWIGTQRDGISILDCDTYRFKNFTMQEGLATNDVTSLAHATDGGMWITHYHVGIEHYNKKTKKLTLFSDKDIAGLKYHNWCALDDGNGNLYVGHDNEGLSIVNIHNKTARNFQYAPNNPNGLPSKRIRAIHIDHQKRIWLGTGSGLVLFHPETETFTHFEQNSTVLHTVINKNILDIIETSDSLLWIASSNGGIDILDLKDPNSTNPEKAQFHTITSGNNNYSLSSIYTRTLLQDCYGNMWIGNYGGGINFISHRQPIFKTLPYTFEKDNKLKNKAVWSIYADNQQQIWLGGENEVAIFKDNQESSIINPAVFPDPYNTHIYAIKQDKQGLFWLGRTQGDIILFNPLNRQYQKLPSNGIFSFCEDINHTMWIATGNGVFSYSKDSLCEEREINKQLGDKIIYSILFDRQGKLWVGTFGKGIYIFDKDKKLVFNLGRSTDFCSNAINQIYMDSRGSIWIATRNGMAYIKDSNKPESFELYNTQQGLNNSHIRAIQEDLDGNIWMSTYEGISRWNSQEQQFENYNHHDDISMRNFAERAACMAADGTLYFGSLNGVCYFNPRELTEERSIAPIQIIECKSLNKQIENQSGGELIPLKNGIIELPYDQNSFRIFYSVPDYTQTQQIEYAYMIEGLEKVWYNTQGDYQVTLRSIPPGNYTFKVKARLKGQEWDESHIATIPIRIHPPLWLTWQAKLLYFILCILILFAILRSYKRKLAMENSLELERRNSQNEQKLNNERLRFYTNITHELRTPLTLILGPLEDLLNDSKLPEIYNKKISIIHSSAMRLLNLINQILEFRKTETQNRKLTVGKGNLGDLVEETGLRFKELSQNPKVIFHIDIADKNDQLYFDADMITTILNNLLSNAMKYTPEGEIRVSMQQAVKDEKQYTEIAVSDTGYGISPQALPHIFDRYYQAEDKHQASGTGIGLALAKSLTELHEGTLRVESELGKGTTFTFSILTHNEYPNALHKEKEEKNEQAPPISELIIDQEDKEEGSDTCTIILVVEDNDEIRDYIAASLADNYKILTATNGKEGLKLAQEYIPNVIVSDIMMPVMDGIELCRAVKEDMRTSHIPVILLTAKDSIQDKEEGYESGADSYLTKPFSAKLLHSRIQNLLEMRRKLALLISANAQKVKSSKEQKPIKLNKLDEEFLVQLTALIEENLEMERLDIAFMTDKLNMSHSTFYRKVKGLTGMSANEFIRKVKLKNSMKLLASGKYNVTETAYMTGFNHLGHFRECFKEEYGMSPSEFLKQQKEEI